MSAASVTAYLSPTMLRKRAISSGESGGAEAFTIFIFVTYCPSSPRNGFAVIAEGARRTCGEPRRMYVPDAVILPGSQELAPQADGQPIFLPYLVPLACGP